MDCLCRCCKAKNEEYTPIPSARIERYLEPCLLLLLKQGNVSYGYQFMERLQQFMPEHIILEPTLMYRTLRQMEEDNLIASLWDTQGTGPARRNYTLTPSGENHLVAWTKTLANNKAAIDYFLTSFKEVFASEPNPTTSEAKGRS